MKEYPFTILEARKCILKDEFSMNLLNHCTQLFIFN